MQAEKAMFHELHLVVDEDLQHTLQELRQEAAERSLAKFISGVLGLLYPRLKHEHFFGKERQARYKLVNAAPGVPRLHVHVDLPYSLYKRMKLMYQEMIKDLTFPNMYKADFPEILWILIREKRKGYNFPVHCRRGA